MTNHTLPVLPQTLLWGGMAGSLFPPVILFKLPGQGLAPLVDKQAHTWLERVSQTDLQEQHVAPRSPWFSWLRAEPAERAALHREDEPQTRLWDNMAQPALVQPDRGARPRCTAFNTPQPNPADAKSPSHSRWCSRRTRSRLREQALWDQSHKTFLNINNQF